MRHLLVLILLFTFSLLKAQNPLGVKIGYSSDQTVYFGVATNLNKAFFFSNFNFHWGKPLGNTEKRNLNLPGTREIDDGKVYYGAEVGMGLKLYKILSLYSELGIFNSYEYTNYTDSRFFSEDGFHMKSPLQNQFAVGGGLSFKISNPISLEMGYNSFSKVKLGITCWID